MMRHEIPTHLEVEDKILGSLTVRQLLFLAVGVSISYGLWGTLSHLASGHLPVALVLLLAAIPAGCTLVLALSQPDGRPFEEWLLAQGRYATLPIVCVWRPLDDEIDGPTPDEDLSRVTGASDHGAVERAQTALIAGGHGS